MKKTLIASLVFVMTLLLPAAYGKSADGEGKIAFTANLDGNWDLFMADADGKNVRRLTKTPYDEKNPSWSPDHQKIIYATTEGAINCINVTPGKIETLLEPDDAGKNEQPAFSPDDKEFVYVHFKGQKVDDTDLWRFDIQTKQARPFLTQYAAQFYPAYSPDGTKVAYTTTHCSLDCGRIIQELWIAASYGGYARQLCLTNSNCMKPSWSPDGSKIAFSSDMKGSFNIWTLDLSSSKLNQLTQGSFLDVSPTWSPEGAIVAFVSNRSGKMKIWLKNVTTKDLKMFEPFPGQDVECKDVAW